MIDQKTIKEAEMRAKMTYDEVKKTKPIPKPKTLQEIAVERIAERALEKDAPVTGYPDLDELIKGFIPGHLYTLTGETNVGKTAIACNFTANVARQGKRVLYVTLEPGNTIVEYLASVCYSKKYSEVTSDDVMLEGLSVDIIGKEDVDSAERMVEIVDNLDRYDLVVIDHVGYFITSEHNTNQQQSNTIKKFVSIAKKKKCAVILIAHLRKRDKHQKRNYIPSADDISGSAAFKQDSTEVLIVTRQLASDDKDEIRFSDQGKIVVAKSKSGPNGFVKIIFSNKSAKIISEGEMYSGSSIVEAAREIFKA